MKLDDLLVRTRDPINKVVFLYECKNDQKIKEFIFQREPRLERSILKDYLIINEAIKNKKAPKREKGRTKGCAECRYCGMKIKCFN